MALNQIKLESASVADNVLIIMDNSFLLLKPFSFLEIGTARNADDDGNKISLPQFFFLSQKLAGPPNSIASKVSPRIIIDRLKEGENRNRK